MKRTLVPVTLLAAVAISSLALLLTRPSRATYKGRSTAQWVAKLGSPDLVDQCHALAAIQAMGTNALPTVIRHLGRGDSALMLRCNQFTGHFPSLHIQFATGHEWRWAMDALVLDSGPESRREAIRALVRLSRDADAGVRRTAVESLILVIFTESEEPHALRALEAAQTDPDASVRFWAEKMVQAHNYLRSLRAMPLNGLPPVDGATASLFEGDRIFLTPAER